LLCCGRCDHASPLYCGGDDGGVLPRLVVFVVATFVIVGFGGEGEAVHHEDPVVAGTALPWSFLTGVVDFVYSSDAGTALLLCSCCINHNSVSSSSS
jgi:hypothetical protein